MTKDVDDQRALGAHVDDVVDSFMAHELMNDVAAYVGRGRRYETTSIVEVEDRWVASFKAWVEDTERPSVEMDDLAAELNLRGLEPPMDRVPNEIARMREKLIALGPPTGGAFRDRISSFLEERDKPSA